MLGYSCSSIQLQQHVKKYPCSPPACRHRPASVLVVAKAGPDRGSVLALESALSAINNILGSYNKLKPAAGKAQQRSTNGSSGGQQQQWAAGPSKLVTFSAKAHTSVPVTEVLSAVALHDSSSNVDGRAEPAALHQQPFIGTAQLQNSSSPSSSDGSIGDDSQHHGSSARHHKQHHSHHHHKQHHRQHHKQHQQQQQQQSSWLTRLTSKIPFASSSTMESLPDAALARSLQAYLALPLEQYSVLDPTLITRLPDGADVESVLADMLAEQKQHRSNRRASQMQQAPSNNSSSNSSSSSSSSSSGSSAAASSGQEQDLPRMRQLDPPQLLQQPQGLQELLSNSGNGPDSSSGAATSSSSSRHDAEQLPAGPSAAAAAASSAAVGAFLLRIPMLELLGVDLEPLLVVYVDVDPQQAQVTFHTNRLVVGDPRFDQEFKVDLTATLNSKVVKPAVPMSAHLGAGHQDSSAGNSSTSSAGDSSASSSSSSTVQPLHLGHQHTPLSAAAAPAAATAIATVTHPDQAAAAVDSEGHFGHHEQQVWQRSSSLSCKVKLGMSLRLPHPLSIVPGPLLSTTAGLVARLVMQALLPSFLELLATDYGRWASGSSTSSRQETAAGSLITAGKQQLRQMRQ